MGSKTYLIVAVVAFCCVAAENVAPRSARSVPGLHPDLHRRYRRIVNGDEATPHSWPWQVYVQCDKCTTFCGGSLVASQWVLTAAHCATDISKNVDKVYLGAHNVAISERSQQRIKVATIKLHPRYDANTFAYDVALLKLRTPADTSNFVSFSTLIAKSQAVSVRAHCVVTGWGVTETGRTSDVLREARVPVLSRPKCQTFWPYIGQEVLCAGADGKGICGGDSGGPLNCKIGGKWIQAGIASFGKAGRRCDPYYPDCYIKVAKVRDFIDSTIRPSN